MTLRRLQEIEMANETDTSTSNISGLQGQQWMDEVVRFGQALRRFDHAVMLNEDLVGSGDKTLTVPKTTSVLSVDTGASESSARNVTEMTNFNTVDLAVSASDFKRGLIAITKEIAMTSRVDLVRQARLEIANALADDLDTDIATELENTSVSQRVFGGSGNSDPSNLATGDVITPDLVADAMAEIEDDNFVPRMLFISPQQLKQFRKDSQFVNASEFGDNRVVRRGEVGEYLGVSVISTTNTPSYASGDTDTNQNTKTWGAAGHACPLVGFDNDGQKVAATVAWKEMPHVDYDYDPDKSLHKVFYNQAYNVGITQPKAVCLIKVTDT